MKQAVDIRLEDILKYMGIYLGVGFYYTFFVFQVIRVFCII